MSVLSCERDFIDLGINGRSAVTYIEFSLKLGPLELEPLCVGYEFTVDGPDTLIVTDVWIVEETVNFIDERLVKSRAEHPLSSFADTYPDVARAIERACQEHANNLGYHDVAELILG